MTILPGAVLCSPACEGMPAHRSSQAWSVIPTRHLPGTYPAPTWHLPGTYPAPTRHLPGVLPGASPASPFISFRYLLSGVEHPTSTQRVSNEHPSSLPGWVGVFRLRHVKMGCLASNKATRIACRHSLLCPCIRSSFRRFVSSPTPLFICRPIAPTCTSLACAGINEMWLWMRDPVSHDTPAELRTTRQLRHPLRTFLCPCFIRVSKNHAKRTRLQPASRCDKW